MAATWATLTPRSTGIIGGGLLSLLLAVFTLHLLLFTLGVLVIGFVSAEYVSFSWSTRGFSPAWFQAERFEAPRHVNRKGLGAVALRLVHGGRAAFYAEIWDSHPQTMKMVEGSPHLVTWWAPGEAVTLVYAFRPYRRGSYALGPTAIFAHDPFGLAFRLTYLATVHEVVVVPSVPAVPLGQFALRLRTRYLGTTVLRRRGYGTEFRSLREYNPADDFRTIAWKRSSRGKLYVKEFEQEMRQDFLILLDASSSMGAGRLGEDALDIAVDAGTVMVNYVMKKDDRLGLLVYGTTEISYLEPKRGPENASRLLGKMAVVNAEERGFDLAAALQTLTARLHDRTHVFAFISATEPDAALQAAFAKFVGAGHRLYAFVPEPYGMYPPYPDAVGRRMLELAQYAEGSRVWAAAHGLRGMGVPVVLYDRGGAVGKVVSLYSTLRTWGWAK